VKWYVFRQNNSGGHFAAPAICLVVEATDSDDAWAKAKQLGAYEDEGGDCPCCGSRWSDYSSEYEERPSLKDMFGRVANSSMYTQCGVPRALYVDFDGVRKEVP
jgi:hypothetical protein